MAGLSIKLYSSNPSKPGIVRRTRGCPRGGDRCSLRWWMKHARSSILRFRSTSLSPMRYRVRYLDAYVSSLRLKTRFCAFATLRPNNLWAIRKSRWRSLRVNPPNLVTQRYRKAVPHGRTARVQPSGAGPPDRHQPNSGPPAGCTTRVGGSPSSGWAPPSLTLSSARKGKTGELMRSSMVLMAVDVVRSVLSILHCSTVP